MKLYELANQYIEIQERFENASTGDDEFELASKLESLEGDIKEKLDNCARILRNLEAQADRFEAEAEKMRAKAHGLSRQADSLKTYIGLCLGFDNQIKTDLFSFRWLTRESVEIESVESIPQQYQRIKTEPDKRLIGMDLKAGAEIPGAKLVQKKYLQIK